ncbi:GIY-YIG nuclease family protein [Burkholderia cepacia]|uniref:Excinuclease ABC C subunit domain protein n=1 Tax=Burkholderia cepacia GG4 TaxID=1009846 RepID=A0A9W3P8F5_BURCE|nr:GIY-YIG nuclease family protein [Burkholderia cepacia]AFQ47461.1 Excinuclease ABC C subunit domain protein [Burkholderia cepacia GG4]
MSWFLYLIECADDSVYTGITNDVAARFEQHASGKGARYTRSRKPRALLASFPLPDRSIASRVEYWVKRLNAAQKRELAAGIRTLESVLPAGMSIDGSVEADGLKAGMRGRKKVKKAQPADVATQAADTEQPVKKAAQAGNDGKASRSAKTTKRGPDEQASTQTKATPARKRAKTGDGAEAKKTSPRSTTTKQDKQATSVAPKRKTPAGGGQSVAKAHAGAGSAPSRGRASARQAVTEAIEAHATPVTAARRATSTKRTKTAPNATALPAPARPRKNTATDARPRTKQNRAAS